jgi:hypothetical protein
MTSAKYILECLTGEFKPLNIGVKMEVTDWAVRYTLVNELGLEVGRYRIRKPDFKIMDKTSLFTEALEELQESSVY